MNLFRNILIIAFLLLVALLVKPAEASVASVRLEAKAVLNVGAVALGMIAVVEAEDLEIQERLESLVVGEVAEGTTQSSIGMYEITRALARANILPASVDIYGATRCRLETLRGDVVEPVEDQDAIDLQDDEETPVSDDLLGVETIRTKLDQLVARQSGLDMVRLKIEWRGKEMESLLGRGFVGERYRIKPRSTMAPGRVLVEVVDRDGQGQGEPKIYRVRGLVSYLCESVVATRPLVPGEVIGIDDVKMLSRRVDDLRDVGIGDLEQVVGQEVARAMPVNMVLQCNMIKRVKLIHRRDVVRVEYNDGRIVLNLQARAEQDGCLGDIIKLNDLIHKRDLQGRIIGAGQVRILGPNESLESLANAKQTNRVNDLGGMY